MGKNCQCPSPSETKCVNTSCENYDEFLNQLSCCPRKTIAGLADCPSIRSCPNCKQAIEHADACNNMECTSCKKHFCFICLKPANANGSLVCSSPHVVAAIQTDVCV